MSREDKKERDDLFCAISGVIKKYCDQSIVFERAVYSTKNLEDDDDDSPLERIGKIIKKFPSLSSLNEVVKLEAEVLKNLPSYSKNPEMFRIDITDGILKAFQEARLRKVKATEVELLSMIKSESGTGHESTIKSEYTSSSGSGTSSSGSGTRIRSDSAGKSRNRTLTVVDISSSEEEDDISSSEEEEENDISSSEEEEEEEDDSVKEGQVDGNIDDDDSEDGESECEESKLQRANRDTLSTEEDPDPDLIKEATMMDRTRLSHEGKEAENCGEWKVMAKKGKQTPDLVKGKRSKKESWAKRAEARRAKASRKSK